MPQGVSPTYQLQFWEEISQAYEDKENSYLAAFFVIHFLYYIYIDLFCNNPSTIPQFYTTSIQPKILHAAQLCSLEIGIDTKTEGDEYWLIPMRVTNVYFWQWFVIITGILKKIMWKYDYKNYKVWNNGAF